MKELKFRAWDIKQQKMFKDYHLVRLVVEKEIKLIRAGQVNEHNDCDDEIMFMQFTGHYDKNGVPIYESDLIKDNAGRVLEVFWSDLGFGRWWFAKNNRYVTEVDLTNIEVIGNIYESKKMRNNKQHKNNRTLAPVLFAGEALGHR